METKLTFPVGSTVWMMESNKPARFSVQWGQVITLFGKYGVSRSEKYSILRDDGTAYGHIIEGDNVKLLYATKEELCKAVFG